MMSEMDGINMEGQASQKSWSKMRNSSDFQTKFISGSQENRVPGAIKRVSLKNPLSVLQHAMSTHSIHSNSGANLCISLLA